CLAIPFVRSGLAQTSEFLGVLQDFVIWGGGTSAIPTTIFSVAVGLGITFGILRLTVDMFVPIGRLLGRLIDAHANTVWAYSVNVAGSLVGVWLFVALGRFLQPPVVWILILAVLLVPLLYVTGNRRWTDFLLLVGAIALAVAAGRTSGAHEVVWSPYQKLGLFEGDTERPNDYVVTVNNAFFQRMIDLNKDHTASDPAHYPPELNGLTQYDIPLLLHPRPRKYLVVGAGSGNDAAAALRHGVPDVTAVEIDPAIIALGRRYHPEHPYESDAVRVINDDARSFFSRTN